LTDTTVYSFIRQLKPFIIIIIIIVVVVVVIGKDTTSFTQGIYTYIPETKDVPKKYNVAAILSLLFMVSISVVTEYYYYYYYYYYYHHHHYYYYLFTFNCNWVDTWWQQ
jgi:hypothetical protein